MERAICSSCSGVLPSSIRMACMACGLPCIIWPSTLRTSPPLMASCTSWPMLLIICRSSLLSAVAGLLRRPLHHLLQLLHTLDKRLHALLRRPGRRWRRLNRLRALLRRCSHACISRQGAAPAGEVKRLDIHPVVHAIGHDDGRAVDKLYLHGARLLLTGYWLHPHRRLHGLLIGLLVVVHRGRIAPVPRITLRIWHAAHLLMVPLWHKKRRGAYQAPREKESNAHHCPSLCRMDASRRCTVASDSPSASPTWMTDLPRRRRWNTSTSSSVSRSMSAPRACCSTAQRSNRIAITAACLLRQPCARSVGHALADDVGHHRGSCHDDGAQLRRVLLRQPAGHRHHRHKGHQRHPEFAACQLMLDLLPCHSLSLLSWLRACLRSRMSCSASVMRPSSW
nr:MAG TPA: hypothetical protein [Caudoviricetes sp.]